MPPKASKSKKDITDQNVKSDTPAKVEDEPRTRTRGRKLDVSASKD
jgi:hypothetical protein